MKKIYLLVVSFLALFCLVAPANALSTPTVHHTLYAKGSLHPQRWADEKCNLLYPAYGYYVRICNNDYANAIIGPGSVFGGLESAWHIGAASYAYAWHYYNGAWHPIENIYGSTQTTVLRINGQIYPNSYSCWNCGIRPYSKTIGPTWNLGDSRGCTDFRNIQVHSTFYLYLTKNVHTTLRTLWRGPEAWRYCW